MNNPTIYRGQQFPMEYKGYTLQIDSSYPYAKGRIMFYPTEEGIQDDADFDGESYKYCGNCKWADTFEDAVFMIDEIVPFLVETRGKFFIGGTWQKNITKFHWLMDAVKFAVQHNGFMHTQFLNP